MISRPRPVVRALLAGLLGAGTLVAQGVARQEGESRLEHALRIGDLWRAHRLVLAGADVVEERTVPSPAGSRRTRTNQLLHRVAQVAGPGAVRILLERGVDVSVRDSFGEVALHYAARRVEPSQEVVDLLVASGADLLAVNEAGHTPLHEAARAYGASPGNVAVLVASGVPVDVRTADQITPLHVGVHRRRFEMVEALLDAGADVHTVDQAGNTPLHYVAGATPPHDTAAYESPSEHGDADFARVLLARGARPDVRNRWGTTPLSLAQKPWGSPEVARVLLGRE